MAESRGKINREELRRYWEGHLQGWKKSNLSQAEYCRENGLRGNRLTYWKRAFRREKSSLSFAAVPINISPQSDVKALVISINSRIKVEVGGDFDPLVFSKVVKTLLELQ